MHIAGLRPRRRPGPVLPDRNMGQLPHAPVTRRKPSSEDVRGCRALGGTVPLWEWIGDEPATTFSY